MKILLVNHYIGNTHYGMDFRPYYLAREWVKMGHQVTMIGATYSHLRRIQPQVEKDLDSEYVDGIKYLWIKTPAYEKGSMKRILNIVTFVGKLLKYAKQISRQEAPDWVIASSCYPLDIYPSHKIARLSYARLCFEVHDIWPLTPMLLGGYSKYHPFIFTMQKAEDYMCKHADIIVSLLWNAETHYRQQGFKGNFYCVPNGYSREEWLDEAFTKKLPKEHEQVITQLKRNGKLIVGFAGGFALSGAADVLVKAAIYLKNNSKIHIMLVGKGPEKDVYLQIIMQNQLANISILPEVSKSLIPSLVSTFDIGYLGGRHSILHKFGTSYNKMTDYMLCSIPIVQAVDEPGSVVEREKCGVRIEAENPSNLADAILKIAMMSKEERAQMGKRGKDYVFSNLEWAVLAEKFLNDLQDGEKYIK